MSNTRGGEKGMSIMPYYAIMKIHVELAKYLADSFHLYVIFPITSHQVVVCSSQ